jgi:protein-L-isoaspartate(D-aspartate) O-methyltransferase
VSGRDDRDRNDRDRDGWERDGRHGGGEAAAAAEADREAAAALILKLRTSGIRNQRLLSAIERVPRRLFLPASCQRHAGEDTALPIECGQTISQPSLVAMMTQALELEPSHKVLELGTGSGYQAAILGLMAGEVHTIERYRTLVDLARERLRSLKITNVSVHHADGLEGLEEHGPYDRIIVTAAAPAVPKTLVDQLADNGRMLMPVGEKGNVQDLVLVVRRGATTERSVLARVRFVPIVEGVAARL